MVVAHERKPLRWSDTCTGSVRSQPISDYARGSRSSRWVPCFINAGITSPERLGLNQRILPSVVPSYSTPPHPDGRCDGWRGG